MLRLSFAAALLRRYAAAALMLLMPLPIAADS